MHINDFIIHLDALQNLALRYRVHARLNKEEACNVLASAIFINRLGEILDSTFEPKRYCASGLNLVKATTLLWNTVFLERTTLALNDLG